MATDGRIKVIGFYHICLINHFMDIVKCQVNCIVESGLYDRTDKIYLGVLGSYDNLKILKSFLNDYPKFEIYSYDHDIIKYEFHTLRILKKFADNEDFYGWYIHTKGCNYPNNEGGKYWLDYMNYYNITLWKDAIHSLDLGHHTYGVKLLTINHPPAYRLHYSGNFFWFISPYVRELDSIESLNNENRYEAETWICSYNPIAATGCQIFVDYNTKGKFEPFIIKSNE